MSRVTVLVYCDWCDDGVLYDGRVCGHCNGQKHFAVNRDSTGGVPAGYREWVDADIGPTPVNPLTLRTDAVKA